jgi:hypothetical protein
MKGFLRAELFQLLKNASRLRDSLKLTVDYRKRFLDTLLNKSDIEPDEIRLEYEHSKARTDAEYDDAEQHAKKIKTMSEPQQSELKDIYRKLVKIYHPDLHGTNSAKAMAYGRLMAIITAAKENGDIDLLREISRDPRQFMENNNLGQFEIDVEEEVETLLRLYDSIQYRIIEIISSTEDLRSDSSYALYQLCMRRPDYIRDVADKYEKDIVKECDELKLEADRLSREIEVLCGECV